VALTQKGGRSHLPRLRDVNHEPTEPAFRWLARCVSVLRWVGDRDWRGTENVPKEGGVLVVVNHTSLFDPLAVGMYLIWGTGRWVRYLGKIQIFTTPGLGWLARACGQIPVERDSARAKDSLAAAKAALNAGKLVGIYPEGTRAMDPDLWPTEGKTGAARLALESDVPVIPIGQWGSHEFMPRGKKGFPLVLSRHHVFRVSAGAPIQFDDLRGQPMTKELLEKATKRIIDAITAQVALVRGEPAPNRRWDPQLQRHVPVDEGPEAGASS
jgi:1-acyl-sn-glycerol-3-phosphate acyltransferase